MIDREEINDSKNYEREKVHLREKECENWKVEVVKS
jgi:hypothetical protein